jgi:hypothetical protein
VYGEDLEDPQVIDLDAQESGTDLALLHAALADGSAAAALTEAESGRSHCVDGMPAWRVAQRLITGLRPAADFERFAQHARKVPR